MTSLSNVGECFGASMKTTAIGGDVGDLAASGLVRRVRRPQAPELIRDLQRSGPASTPSAALGHLYELHTRYSNSFVDPIDLEVFQKTPVMPCYEFFTASRPSHGRRPAVRSSVNSLTRGDHCSLSAPAQFQRVRERTTRWGGRALLEEAT
jgi:hypothetical protein